MEIDETDNPAEAGTDSITPSDADNSDDYSGLDSFWNNETEEDTEGTEDETDEVETADEMPEDQEADDAAENEPVYAADTALVRMADGSEVPISELMAGQMRQADYSRKTQNLSNRVKTFDADVQRFESIQNAFIDRLAAMIPEAPAPEMAYKNPEAFTKQKAAHDAAVMQIQQLVSGADQVKDVKSNLTSAQHQQQVQEEMVNLVNFLPSVSTDSGKAALRDDVKTVAEKFGFSDGEINQAFDSRIFAMAHYAAKGIRAEQAMGAAKAKVAKAPPQKRVAPKANGNREAMSKLSRSGSIRDAMKVDWD